MSDTPTDKKNENDVNGPATRTIAPENGKTDHLKDKTKDAESRQEALVDQAVEESMDASDPPSPKHIT